MARMKIHQRGTCASLLPPLLLATALTEITLAQSYSAVSCSSIDTSWSIATCIGSSQYATIQGNCAGGVKEETIDISFCPLSSPNCHDCSGSNRVVCSDSTDGEASCADFAAGACAEVDNGFSSSFRCFDTTTAVSQQVTCQVGSDAVINTETSTCAEVDSTLPACLDCGNINYCVPPGTTCENLNTVDESPLDSPVTCGSVDHSFVVDRCINGEDIWTNFGDCTNGVKNETVILDSCLAAIPFCHECGFNKIVCSASPNQATACSDFPGDVPTGTDCAQVGNGVLYGSQCNSATGFVSEVLACQNGMDLLSEVIYGNCADDNAALTLCLDCDRVGYCVPEGTRCDDLGPSTNPPVTNPPVTNPPATDPPTTDPPSGAAGRMIATVVVAISTVGTATIVFL